MPSKVTIYYNGQVTCLSSLRDCEPLEEYNCIVFLSLLNVPRPGVWQMDGETDVWVEGQLGTLPTRGPWLPLSCRLAKDIVQITAVMRIFFLATLPGQLLRTNYTLKKV